MHKWLPYMEGTPHVVLDGVLYATEVGQVRFAWLTKGTSTIVKNMPVRRVGIVPKTLRTALPNTGYKVKQLSF
jgi:hypothetical protein